MAKLERSPDTEGAKRPRPTEQLKRPKAENEVYLDPVFYLDGAKLSKLGINIFIFLKSPAFLQNHCKFGVVVSNTFFLLRVMIHFGWYVSNGLKLPPKNLADHP